MTLNMLVTCDKTCMLHLHNVKQLSMVGLAVGKYIEAKRSKMNTYMLYFERSILANMR